MCTERRSQEYTAHRGTASLSVTVAVTVECWRRSRTMSVSLTPGFHYLSWRPELTGDRFTLPVNTRQHVIPLAKLTAGLFVNHSQCLWETTKSLKQYQVVRRRQQNCVWTVGWMGLKLNSLLNSTKHWNNILTDCSNPRCLRSLHWPELFFDKSNIKAECWLCM